MAEHGFSDQYASPSAPIEAELVKPASARTPGGLTTVCVIALALGGMGLLSAMGQALNLAMGGNVQNAWSQIGSAGMPPEIRESQTRMMRSIQTSLSRYAGVNTVLTVLQSLLAGGLLYGAYQSIRLKSFGRDVLFWSLCLAVPFEIVRSIPATMLQMDMATVMEENMSTMLPQGGGDGGRFGSAIAKMSMIIGIGMSVVWGLAKIGFYVVGAKYLVRHEIRSLFVNATSG